MHEFTVTWSSVTEGKTTSDVWAPNQWEAAAVIVAADPDGDTVYIHNVVSKIQVVK